MTHRKLAYIVKDQNPLVLGAQNKGERHNTHSQGHQKSMPVILSTMPLPVLNSRSLDIISPPA
jgi:hypothetical protein